MKISDNVYLLDSTGGSYVYIVMGNETALVDTGLPWKGKIIMKELGSIGIKPGDIEHILLTHHDIDHIGNVFMLQQLTGAQVWASKEDIPYITGEIDRYGFKKYLKYFFKVKKPKDIKPYIPGRRINGIDVIPTPGHTPGHVCLLYNDILFAGDLLENKKGKLMPYPPPWNWNDSMMLESVDKISQIPNRWVCPAHGKPICVK
jgi:glyoxylase-like metal-dependent hydrolase (beta-lactamase superfamily II)